jgi:imidazolonepropionase-like amidohydrolase
MTTRSRAWLWIPLAAAALVGLVFWLPTPEDSGRSASTPAAPVLPSGSFEIRDVRLFDGERVLERATVRVENGLIAAVNPATAGDALPVVDGKGRTLLPGLIDAHTHSWGDALERALAFGVTTQLDQFGDVAMARDSRLETAPDRADLFTAGNLITRPGGHGTQFRPGTPALEATADEGAVDAFVAARIAEGSDWIKLVIEDGHEIGMPKLLPTLDAATVRAVVDAAHRRGKLAVAHVHALDAARMAVDAGVDGLVHTVVDALPDEAFARRLAENKVFVVPTLSVLGPRAALADDPRLAPFLTRAEGAQLRGPDLLAQLE